MADRPLGIAILAILGIISGILILLGSLAILGLAGIVSTAFLTDTGVVPIPEAMIAVLGAIFGIVLLVIAIIVLLASRGLWSGSNWARVLLLIIYCLMALGNIWSIVGFVQAGLAVSTFTGAIVSLLIDLFFLYYLTRPHVVNFFR